MQKKNLISQSAYAKLRKLSPSTISRQIEAGVIPTHGEKRLVDIAEADAARRANLDPDRGKRKGRQADAPSLSESRAAKEAALAGLRQLDLARASGEAVAIEDAQQVWNIAISNARARLLRIPSAAAPELARESDPTRVESILRKLVFDALTELSRGLDEK